METDVQSVKKRFNLREAPLFSPATDIFPGTMLPIISMEDPAIAILARWGLIPRWAKDPKIGYKMINARSETLTEKPAFRKPFLNGRCLVPATGFFEWQKQNDRKIPYRVTVNDQEIFAFAGLTDQWQDDKGERHRTFSIITTEPNSVLLPIHQRMPVILDRDQEAAWLNPDIADYLRLSNYLKPYPASATVIEVFSGSRT